MTTEVIIKANHGWPVRVVPLAPGLQAVGPERRVEPGETLSLSVHSSQDLLVHEIQPGEEEAQADLLRGEPILQFFRWDHLPEKLAAVSRPFGDLARRMVVTLPRNPERTVALRKLLESKDAAVRAAVMV